MKLEINKVIDLKAFKMAFKKELNTHVETCIFLRKWFFVNFGESYIFSLVLENKRHPIFEI
jgi:hypothetical protein